MRAGGQQQQEAPDTRLPHLPLVTALDLDQVQEAVGDGGGDQLVAASLITIGGAVQDVEPVEGLALLVGLGSDVQDRGGRDTVRGEATLGLGLAREGLGAQQVVVLRVKEGQGPQVSALEGTDVPRDRAIVSSSAPSRSSGTAQGYRSPPSWTCRSSP